MMYGVWSGEENFYLRTTNTETGGDDTVQNDAKTTAHGNVESTIVGHSPGGRAGRFRNP